MVKKIKARKLLFKLASPEERANHLLHFYNGLEKMMVEMKRQMAEINQQSSGGARQAKRELEVYIVNHKKEVTKFMIEVRENFSKSLNDLEKSHKEHKEISSKEYKILKDSFQKKIDQIVSDLEQMGNNGGNAKLWGGGSRTLYLNGVTMSPQNLYSDINFIPGTGVTISAVNNEQSLQADVTISASGGKGGFTYINEIVSGSGTSFTLAHVPVDSTRVALYGGGSRLTPGTGNDYTISGAVIIMANSYASGQVLADYS